MTKLLLKKYQPGYRLIPIVEVKIGELFYLDPDQDYQTTSINWNDVLVDWESTTQIMSIMIDSSGNVGVSQLDGSGFFSLRGWIDCMNVYIVNPVTHHSLPNFVYQFYEKIKK